jgi:hypothetical protein
VLTCLGLSIGDLLPCVLSSSSPRGILFFLYWNVRDSNH